MNTRPKEPMFGQGYLKVNPTVLPKVKKRIGKSVYLPCVRINSELMMIKCALRGGRFYTREQVPMGCTFRDFIRTLCM